MLFHQSSQLHHHHCWPYEEQKQTDDSNGGRTRLQTDDDDDGEDYDGDIKLFYCSSIHSFAAAAAAVDKECSYPLSYHRGRAAITSEQKSRVDSAVSRVVAVVIGPAANNYCCYNNFRVVWPPCC